MAVLATFLVFMATIALAECSISNETTVWGGNERVVINESKPIAPIRGRVVQNTDVAFC